MAQSCSACAARFATGPRGAGTGRRRRGCVAAPADFSRKQPGSERVRAVLLHGVPGTAMTPMQQNLSESDREALVLFVRSLFEGGPRGKHVP